MERESDGDELDASYPESGVKPTNPMEDDEDGGDDEADPTSRRSASCT